MYLNPSYAGANFCPRWIMNYRNQWPALAGDYVTYSTSFDFGLKKIADAFEKRAIDLFKNT